MGKRVPEDNYVGTLLTFCDPYKSYISKRSGKRSGERLVKLSAHKPRQPGIFLTRTLGEHYASSGIVKHSN